MHSLKSEADDSLNSKATKTIVAKIPFANKVETLVVDTRCKQSASIFVALIFYF